MFMLVSVSLQLQALPQQAIVPGGLAMLKINDYTPDIKVSFEGKRVAVFRQGDSWIALAGISLKQKPGPAEFSIQYANGIKLNTSIDILPKKYTEQHLTIKNKRKVNPYKQDMTRISAESQRKKKAKRHWSADSPQVDFIWPTAGRISSIFGLRRFFNEQERKPHSGLDIAAAEGTPVYAAADGTVIESGDFFFSGNMIYIDHGQGIISLYAHLHTIDVKPGERIQQGQQIGSVGETGRVTGPHLHFSVIANQILIDPIFMLPPESTPKVANKAQ
jgi:murein DD-endopeptidase MepM/ murein hydrolase activator NlpD